MMTTLDRRMLDGMQAKGLLDGQSRALVMDLLQQGCTFEQAVLGTCLVPKPLFIDELASLGTTPEEYGLASRQKMPQTKLRSLNTEIEAVLRQAFEKEVYEIVFVPTRESVRVLFGESSDVTELPKALYPALAMRLRRWGNRLGWVVKDFRTHAHEGIRLIRAVKRAASHPVEQSEALAHLKEGQSGIYVFVKPDAYVMEHYLMNPPEEALVIVDADEEAIESALHEALFGGTVLVSTSSTRPAWWQTAADADVPVHIHA